MAEYTLPELAYDYSALEPHISGADHGAAPLQAPPGLRDRREHRPRRSSPRPATAGNLANVNKLEKDLAFNLGGHVNHSIFWTNLSPDGGDKPDRRARRGDRRRTSARSTSSRRTSPPRRSACRAPAGPSSPGTRSASSLIIVQLFDQQGNVAAGTVPLLHARRLGARLLPRLQERARRLRQGVLEHRQLGERRSSASTTRAREDRRPAATVVAAWVSREADLPGHRRPFSHHPSTCAVRRPQQQEYIRVRKDRHQRLRPHRP